MKVAVVAVMVLLLEGAIAAESLMFSPDELVALDGARSEEAADVPAVPMPPPSVHLAAIMPSGGGGWLARVAESWLAEGDRLGELRVERIEAQAVRFLWSGEPRPTRFTLRPNQTIDLATGGIREGR